MGLHPTDVQLEMPSSCSLELFTHRTGGLHPAAPACSGIAAEPPSDLRNEDQRPRVLRMENNKALASKCGFLCSCVLRNHFFLIFVAFLKGGKEVEVEGAEHSWKAF